MSRPTYEYDFDPDAPNNTAANVYRLALGGGERVLDLGSGPGIVAAHLHREAGRKVTCLDSEGQLLALARERGVGDTVLADLNTADWVEALDGRQFDVIILADVLEHLIDPGGVLDAIREHGLLDPAGFVVVSIPNAAHDAVVGELLTDHFTYHPTGLLDETHIRFFTKDSFIELAEQHGFDVTSIHRTLRSLEQTEFKARANDLDPETREALGRRGIEGRTYQYVMRLVPLSAPARAAELRRRIDELQVELLNARSEGSESAADAERARSASEKLKAEAEAASAKAAREAEAASAKAAKEKGELEFRYTAERDRREQLAAKMADLQRSNRRQRRILAEQRNQQLRRLEAIDVVVANKDSELKRLQTELAALTTKRGNLERELAKMRESFTWKAGRVVKSLIYPAALVKRLVRGTRRAPRSPTRDSSRDEKPASPADTNRQSAPQPPLAARFDLTESSLRDKYEAEVSRAHFEGSGGRRISLAATTLDFDKGRGDVYVAVGIGRYLRSLGADVVYRGPDSWYDYEKPPDVVIALYPGFRPSQLDPEVRSIAWVRNEVDNWLAHHELQMFDAILCSSERSQQAIAKLYAGPTLLLPIGVDTELFALPADDQDRTGVVSTVSQWGREREVNRALRSAPISFPLAIYGETRGLAETLKPYSYGLVSYFSLPGLYQQAAIVLDDFNHTTVEWGNVNSRIFESLAAGALPITNTALGLPELGLGEVPTYDQPNALNPLVENLLNDPGETAALCKRLSEVVRTQHGYDRRAEDLTAFLEKLHTSPVEDRAVIGFFPDYRATNPYQRMLYGRLEQAEALAVPIALSSLSVSAPPFKRTDGGQVFHLHWTAPILGPAKTEREALAAAHSFLARLDRFIDEGGRFMWTVHNVMPHECSFPGVETMLRQELADRAHVIHVMCAATQEATSEFYDLPRERLRVIPHSSFIGIYPDHYGTQAARIDLGLAPDDIALLVLGGIRPYKGIDQLLDAFDEALLQEPRLRLLVAGKPGRFVGVKELEERCHSHPRIIANFNEIADDDLQVFFKGSDVVVLPNRSALNSGALMLAYSFARPVIAPATGCLAERLDPNASLAFDPANGVALVEALGNAAKLANRDAQMAARHIGETYLPAAMAEDFAQVVKSMLIPKVGR